MQLGVLHNWDYQIELLDSERFYAALGLTRRPTYESYDDWYESFGHIETATIMENEGPY